jgi:type IV secretion system protein VirB9
MKWLAALTLLVSVPALGQVRPVPAGGDPMHQSVAYAEGQTVVLEASPGFELTVELDPREQIKSAAAGDRTSWQISAPSQANQFFVRPSPGAASTNLTVVTNRRTYYFLLAALPQMTASNALSVRFTYQQQAASVQTSDAQAKRISGSYRVRGAAPIRPSLIWDDGEKTFLDWPEGVEAPAIFAIDSSGAESLVNVYYRDGRFVIDAIYTRLVFRLDQLMARADRKAGQS